MAILRRRDPLAGLVNIRQDLDDIFSDFLTQSALSPTADIPVMDIYSENDKEFVTEVHLPGFSPEDIEIKVQDNILEISGRHREETEDRDRNRTYMMRQSAASFYRSLVLPKDIDADKLKADFENGVLTIRAPFNKQSTAKKVTVNLNKSGRNRDKRKETGD